MKTTTPALVRQVHAAILAFCLASTASTMHAATYTWTGEGTNNSWGSGSNWSGGTAPAFIDTDDLVFNTLTRGTNSVGATNRAVRSITFGDQIDGGFVVNYNTFNGGTGVNLTMSAGSGDASITVDAGAEGNITMGTNTGWTGTFSNLVLATNLNVIHNGTGLLLFNRQIAGAGVALTKSGTGTMQLNNFNTNFTGAYNINEGTLVASAFATNSANSGLDLDTASAINLGGGTLWIRGNSTVSRTYTNPPVKVNAASTLVWSNASTNTSYGLVLSGFNTLALNPGSLVVLNASANTALTNPITISRNITGSGDLTNMGYNNIASSTNNYALGRLTLSGANANWNGDLVVARGTVNLGGNGTNVPAGKGTIVLGSTGDSFGAGLGTFFTTNVVPLNGDVFISNNIIVRAGGFRSLRPAGDHRYNFTGDITLEGSLNVDSALNFYTDKWINLPGNISGAGGLDITRTSLGGYIELSGSNSYAGPTTLSNGATLRVTNGNAIPDTSAVGLFGPLATNGPNVFTNSLRILASETIGSLSASGPEAAVVINAAAVLSTGGDNSSTTYAGRISGGGGLVKAGTGTMTLNGTNAHGGDTVVNSGRLELGPTGSLAFVIGASGINNAVSGPGSALFRGTFNIDLAAASTNSGDSWTLVSVALPAYDGGFQVDGFTNNSGTWSRGTNGVTYQFTQSSGVLTVVGTNTAPYSAWVGYWQGVDPGFTNTAGAADPDGDGFDNNLEFAFDGNPTVGTPALLSVTSSGTNAVFRYVARNTGATYGVRGTTNLAGGPWTNALVTVTNSAETNNVFLPADYTRKEFTVPAAGREFFRVEAVIAP